MVELRIYAPETPEVSGGEVTKLADVGPLTVYLGTTRRRRYEVRCCGKTRRFRSPPAAASPPVTAMYEVLPDRAADRLSYSDLRRHVKRRGGTRHGCSRLFRRSLSTPHISRHELPSIRRGEPYGRRRDTGGWASFVALRDALRKIGMRLLSDVVLYHVGLRNPLFPGALYLKTFLKV